MERILLEGRERQKGRLIRQEDSIYRRDIVRQVIFTLLMTVTAMLTQLSTKDTTDSDNWSLRLILAQVERVDFAQDIYPCYSGHKEMAPTTNITSLKIYSALISKTRTRGIALSYPIRNYGWAE